MAGDSANSGLMNSTMVSCPLFPDNPNHCTVIINVRRAFASLSLIGCVFMIFVIWLFKKYAAFSQRMILYLSIAALNSSISYLMGHLHPDGPVCDFQAFWMTFWDWAVLLWISCITLNLFCNVTRGITTEKYEWAYHIFCWGVALFMSCLPFIGNHYGPAGAWCWIKDDLAWRLGVWYGPLFFMLFTLMVVYIHILYSEQKTISTFIATFLEVIYYSMCDMARLAKSPDRRKKIKVSTWAGTYDPDTERSKQMLKEDIKPLRAYPFIYLAVSMFPLINRIQNAVDSEHHVFALVLLASISSPLHGAINAVVFGMDKETFSRLTPSQIKMSLQGRFSKKALIQEYPEEDVVNDDPPLTEY